MGLLLHTTAGTAASLRPGAEAVLATTLVVREESLTLYGFADEDERAVFNLVQTVSGVGPRLALAMLAIHTPDGLRRAVSGGDLAALTKVPGIGKKGAERIVLELRDKIGCQRPALLRPLTSRAATADESTHRCATRWSVWGGRPDRPMTRWRPFADRGSGAEASDGQTSPRCCVPRFESSADDGTLRRTS